MNNEIQSRVTPRSFAIALLITASLVAGIPLIASAETLNRQLEIGMRGSDVSTLQSFLAQDITLYPQGLVTGYFGFLTKAAVSNFQIRNGISAVGRVGPITLVALNLQMAGGVSSGAKAPAITAYSTSASRNNVAVTWNTDENAKGVVYYSTSPLTLVENTNSANVSGNTAMTDSNFRTSQNVGISGLSANTVYYYSVYATDQDGNVSMTWPATFQTTN